MAKILIENLTKTFGKIRAVQNVNLHVRDREYLCIIGPSGCGKTTLIKCIAGILTPDSGEIYFDEKPIMNLPIQDRGIGYVFQEIALFPHLNVYENVSYGPIVKGVYADRTRSIVVNTLDMLQLRERMRDPPQVLSGGARQKAAIARALASGSKIFLLDEPLGALDLKVRSVLRYELRRLIKDLGLTAIHVTHDQEEAMAIADRIVVMKSGKIIEVGTPRDLYLYPKEIFTANFLGESNFLLGEVSKTSNRGSIVAVNRWKIRSTMSIKPVGSKVVISIRPEFILLEKRKKISRGHIIGEVVSETFLGSVLRYEIETEDANTLTVKVLPQYYKYKPTVGEVVSMRLLPQMVRIYSFPEEGLEKAIALE